VFFSLDCSLYGSSSLEQNIRPVVEIHPGARRITFTTVLYVRGLMTRSHAKGCDSHSGHNASALLRTDMSKLLNGPITLDMPSIHEQHTYRCVLGSGMNTAIMY
jgi:hypothetical protein